MDNWSSKCATYRRNQDKKTLNATNKTAYRTLQRYGSSLFKFLKTAKERPVNTLEDIFGDELGQVVLNLDEQTRRFPWELLFDGTGFLCTKYAVGRTGPITNKVERFSGYPPQNNKALVVGLNYDWLPFNQLETPETEALQVARRLKKLQYNPIILRGSDATIESVKKILSQGLAVFHYTGHGDFYPNQPEGKKGRLILRDGDLTEEDLRECFDKAKGAPYFSFLNACRSGKEIYNSHLMDAFFDLGAENFIGNMWSVYDYPSRDMSVKLYDELVRGNSFGEALLLSRWQYDKSREHANSSTWPALVLYGPPGNKLRRG